MPDTLNIAYHTKILVLRALNREKTIREAAEVLGVSEKTLYNLMKEYNIKRESVYVVRGKYKVINML